MREIMRNLTLFHRIESLILVSFTLIVFTSFELRI
ncbi:hypothetical protein AURMO_01783 [Aurantimicrobium photophilum]|jgi:hypothetical protein|uniref:Uncharacterized protein n=1 Tax=Aurantimicrobium photophilum TaxID=1987356 RepID=A0A2Z3S2D3_9MICO|nr:hypothetical protein AURMO_01783 [Aurantimicrobium photophilum]